MSKNGGVVSFVNPKNSIRQIAKANNMSDMEIRRIVYGLEQAGLVELVKPPGMEAASASRRSTSGTARATGAKDRCQQADRQDQVYLAAVVH